MPRDIHHRAIVIYGASSGIGRATALACANAGMRIVAAARRVDRLDNLVSEIRTKGGTCISHRCDVTSVTEVEATFQYALAEFGSVHAVMANAGYAIEGSAPDLPDGDLRSIFETNVFGTMHVIRAALPYFRKHSSGHILITSSCLSRFTLPYYSAYSATKAAQTQIGRSLRLELAPQGIDVSVVHPITTLTEFFEVSAAHSGKRQADMPVHAPGMFIQRPDRVANAVVRCLRRPKAEVWTSHIVRLAAGAMVASPRFHDFCARFGDRGRPAQQT